jgi:hypothetical protein
VKKRFSLEMKKEQFRTYEAAEAMAAAIPWQSETMFSLFERRPGAKCELAAFILAQEASIGTEMGVREIAGRRTSPRRSGGNKSAAWSAWRSLAAILTKAKNAKCGKCNCFYLLRFSGNHRDTPRM